MPYAPGITYTGDRSIYGGLQSGNELLAKYLMKYLDDRSEGKGLEAAIAGTYGLHQNDPEFVSQFHDQFQKVGQMSNAQRKAFAGTLAGYAANRHLQKVEENTRLDNERANTELGLRQDAAKAVTLRNAALGRVAQQINNPPTGAPWSPEVLDQNSSEIGILKSALAANPEAMTPELAAHLATLAGQQAKVKPPWAPGVVKLTRADGTEVEGYMKGPNDFTPFPEKIPPMSNVAEDVVDTEGNVLGKATRDTKTGKLVHQPLKPEPMVTVPLNPGELFGPTIRLPESEYLRRKAATNAPTAGVGSPPVVQGRGGRMDVIPNRPLAALRRLEDTAPPDSGAPEAAPAAAADGLPDIEVARKLALRHITRGVPADAIRQRFRQLYGEDLGGGVYSEGLGE